MTYKHACLSGALALSLVMLSTSCDNNDFDAVDNAVPTFDVKSEHVRTEMGRDITFSGTIKDADGIASIYLYCPDLNLNKSIDLLEIYGEPLTEYNLDYTLRVRDNVKGESFDVAITITDVMGNKTEKNVLVTLDGDFTAPIFETAPDSEVTVLFKENPTFNLSFSVRDNREIDYIEVDVEGVAGFPITVQGQGKNRIEFAQRLQLPTAIADYKVTIKAADVAAQEGEVRTTEINSTIKVQELPDWDNLYLADVATAAELNSDVFGVPMVMDHVGVNRYRVHYYNEKAGTQICFIPQKTDFGPICFGPDPENPSVLGDDPDAVGRVTLDQAGVYYTIEVNTFDRTVSLESYPVSEAVNPVMHLHYGQNDLNTWWETNNMADIWWQEWYFGPTSGDLTNVMRMEQDKNNPNIYIISDYKLPAGEMNMVLHNMHTHGWWNFTAWRVDDSSDPSRCAYYGNYHPTTPHYESNDDYFDWKFKTSITNEEYKFMYPNAGEEFNLGKWGDEAYRKNFIPDNWIKANVPSEGTYVLTFDAHAERIKLLKK